MKIARYLVALMVTSACTPSASPPEAGEPPALARQASGLDGGTPSCPSDAGSCVPVSPAITQGESCPDSRWIAVLPDATNGCPYVPPGESGHWNRAQLFQPSSGGWSLPSGLARFCAYTWAPNTSGGTPSQQDVNQLQETLSQAETLDRDCHVVAPLGTNATIDAGWTTLHEHFHQQTGRLASLPVDSSSFPEEVRVAVVDSTPHGYDGGEAGQDRLGHGHALGRIIRELGCPEGSPACVAQVANHLALPLVTPTVTDTENGGYFGLQTHLARAIHSSVSEWRSYYNENLGTGASPQPRLVVNLSLAWDGRYGGAYNALGDLPAPVRAVHAAITHAVCRGALVVAAAGNDPGGPDPVIGPMFPAGWETKAAPTPSDCEDLEGKGYRNGELYPSFPPPGWSGYRPLVYAVGGVRGDDRPLASTRPGGRPRTAAPGAHAVAEDANGSAVPTDVLTGTSASTAVVSGIAATVWGYRPELSGPEVMSLIRQASVDLGQPADFCLGGSPACPWGVADPRRSIRRVSLCQSVLEACSGELGRCPVASVLPQVCPSHPASLPRLTAAQAEEAGSHINRPVVPGSELNISLPPLDVCGHTTLHSGSSSYEETVCPFRQYYGAPLRPWSNPVASKNPCTACRMQTDATSSTATLYLGIDSDFASRGLYEPTLKVNRSHEIELSNLLKLTGGDEVKVTDIQLNPTWLPVTYAELTLKGPGNDSYSSELLLE